MTLYPKQAIREGDNRSDLVKLVQTRINELGLGPIMVDGVFRGATRSAVRLFQTRNGLEPDGVVGPVTWAALFGQPPIPPALPPSSLLAIALDVATSQVGVRETGGPNHGPEVDGYLASIGLPPGNSYCQAFVFWCFAEAAVRIGIKNPVPKTGLVDRHWMLAPIATKISAEMTRDELSIVMPGALFLIDHGNGHGHTGFVTAVKSTGLETTEGNTNLGGSSNGDGVYARTRRFGEINLGYIDYSRVV